MCNNQILLIKMNKFLDKSPISTFGTSDVVRNFDTAGSRNESSRKTQIVAVNCSKLHEASRAESRPCVLCAIGSTSLEDVWADEGVPEECFDVNAGGRARLERNGDSE